LFFSKLAISKYLKTYTDLLTNFLTIFFTFAAIFSASILQVYAQDNVVAPPSNQVWKIGDKVGAQWNKDEKYFGATIVQTDRALYKVHYKQEVTSNKWQVTSDKWQVTSDEWQVTGDRKNRLFPNQLEIPKGREICGHLLIKSFHYSEIFLRYAEGILFFYETLTYYFAAPVCNRSVNSESSIVNRKNPEIPRPEFSNRFENSSKMPVTEQTVTAGPVSFLRMINGRRIFFDSRFTIHYSLRPDTGVQILLDLSHFKRLLFNKSLINCICIAAKYLKYFPVSQPGIQMKFRKTV